MKRKLISQREARQWKRRAEDLKALIQRQRSTYAEEYLGGTHLGHVSWAGDTHIASAVYTAKRLGHAVVAVSDGSRKFNLYALPHPEIPVSARMIAAPLSGSGCRLSRPRKEKSS